MQRKAFGEHKKWLSEAGLKQIHEWAVEGRSKAEIATGIGIAPKTLAYWQAHYPAIAIAIAGDKLPVITDCAAAKVVGKVELSLYRSALDRYVEETTVVKSDLYGTTKTTTKKFIPGSVPAQKFVLSHLDPERFGAGKDSKVTIDVANTIKEARERLQRAIDVEVVDNGTGEKEEKDN
jgi:hypothetical protein